MLPADTGKAEEEQAAPGPAAEPPAPTAPAAAPAAAASGEAGASAAAAAKPEEDFGAGDEGLAHFFLSDALHDCAVRLAPRAGDAGGAEWKCHGVVLCSSSVFFYRQLIGPQATATNAVPRVVELPAPVDEALLRQLKMEASFPLALKYAYHGQHWESIREEAEPLLLSVLLVALLLRMRRLAGQALDELLGADALTLCPAPAAELLRSTVVLGAQDAELAVFQPLLEGRRVASEALMRNLGDATDGDLDAIGAVPLDTLVPILAADDLEVPSEGFVLRLVRHIISKRETDGAPMPVEDVQRLLSAVRFRHLRHEELLEALQIPALAAAGASEQILHALSGRLAQYEQVGSALGAAEASKPPRPATLQPHRRRRSPPRPARAASPVRTTQGLTGLSPPATWSPSALEGTLGAARLGSVAASRQTPLFFQRGRKDFDEGGALFWLGTRGLTQGWRNPAGLGFVQPLTSGVGFGAVEDIVGRAAVNLRSTNQPGSYFGVDLLVGRLLVLQGYCLRNRSMTSHTLTAWEIQASLDGLAWETLDARSSGSLRREGATAYFEVLSSPQDADGAPRGYRCFRVLQTARNSSGSDNLALSGLELYGYAVAGSWP